MNMNEEQKQRQLTEVELDAIVGGDFVNRLLGAITYTADEVTYCVVATVKALTS
jgi:hypothetical protein